MTADNTQAWPSELRLHKDRKTLTVTFTDGQSFDLPAEYLRVKSPSAEVQGHSAEERKTVPGKRNVGISAIEAVGQYAVRLRFDDGHDTGLYSWDVFDNLGREQEKNWARYLERLAEVGMSRDRDVTKLAALPKKYIPGQ